MEKKIYSRLVHFFLGLTLLLSVMFGAGISPVFAESHPTVIPPIGDLYGILSARWWQWVYSIPQSTNPLLDDTGVNCGVGQYGPVWYLVGTFNASGTVSGRNCTVPKGVALFFPIINAECSTVEGNGTSYADLKACAKGFADDFNNLAVTLDGVSIKHLQNYRAASPLFTFGPLPMDNLLQGSYPAALPGVTSRSVADGYYILFAPLNPGKHTLHFHGEYGTIFILDINYNLTVKG